MLCVLQFHGAAIAKDSGVAAHLAQKAVSSRIEAVRAAAPQNLDLMNFLCAQPDREEDEETEQTIKRCNHFGIIQTVCNVQIAIRTSIGRG
jgi:hypothetical protein